MLEIEIKYPVDALRAVEARIITLGARRRERREEIDHYLNAPDRDFARTDEALRIRRIGEHNFVTYKGPKVDSQTKTRTEIEVPLRDGDDIAPQIIELFRNLGYRSVVEIRKNRTVYEMKEAEFDLEICLDSVAGVGEFVELEIMAEEDQLEAARNVLQDIAGRLGLASTERRSYLELWLAKQR